MPSTQPRHYLMDGTFSITPCCKIFKQVLIVHYAHAEHTFPFIYILMSSKSEAAYIHVLQFIKANLFDMKPTSIQTDFETALRNGIKNVYPQAIMKPCWFHYIQALRRNASKTSNFMRYLNNNAIAKRHFQKFLYLPLLKPNDLIAAYEMLKKVALSTTFAIHEDAESFFVPFIKYFERQWIRKEGAATISVYKEKSRTTSSIEGYNSQLSAKLSKNGNFFKFLDVILDQEFAKVSDLQKSVDGHVSIYETRKNKRKNQDDFIDNTLKKLEDGVLSLHDVMNRLTSYKTIVLPRDVQQSTSGNNKEIDDEADNDQDKNEKNIDNNSDISCGNKNMLLCEICCENARSVLLVPCNHYKLCSNCYEKIKESYVRRNVPILCPICRQIVENSTRIYI